MSTWRDRCPELHARRARRDAIRQTCVRTDNRVSLMDFFRLARVAILVFGIVEEIIQETHYTISITGCSGRGDIRQSAPVIPSAHFSPRERTGFCALLRSPFRPKRQKFRSSL